MNHLPISSFFQSRPARIALARRRFFDEGQAPTGVVSQAVFESWARCHRRHGDPGGRATFQPVTASRAQLALTKNRPLHQAWTDEVPRLVATLGVTSCAAMLTDATGVLIGSSCVGRSHESLMPVATRVGVDLSEDAVGTTAPGVVARTGKPVCVLGGEHYFDSVGEMHCAAAPIRDIHGEVAGVLDLSSECIPFAFDAGALAGLFAGAIENRLLVAQSNEHLVIRFQAVRELVDTAMVGLIGIGPDGRIAWANGVARSLLGPSKPEAADDAFGMAWSQLAALPATEAAPLALPNGLHVWARADMRAPDGRRGLVGRSVHPTVAASLDANDIDASPTTRDCMAPGTPAADPPAALAPEVASTSPALRRLREADIDHIRKTLKACNGNVSDAAKRLGVSRGLIYRRLREMSPSSQSTDA
jgi:sigma-54 dependent transcriptional regulator, acetoin dehydrogenase operon transcriptional activator AcoR